LRGIYAIVNAEDNPVELARAALDGGIRIVQYRAKRGIVPSHAEQLRRLTSEFGGGGSPVTNVEFLKQAGCSAEMIRLRDYGIHGNGNLMLLEKNNHEVFALMQGWLEKIKKLDFYSGELAAEDYGKATQAAERTEKLATDMLKTRTLDAESHLPIALGAAIETEAKAMVATGQRASAIVLSSPRRKLPLV